MSDLGLPPNNLSVCGNCYETQMDVETLQAFAPQAVTFFVPTEKLTGPQIVPYVFEAARSAGYTEDQIQQLSAEFESEGPDSPGVKRTIAQLYSAISKAYFRDFVSDVTSSEPRVQVVSLSWNSDYTDEIGDFKSGDASRRVVSRVADRRWRAHAADRLRPDDGGGRGAGCPAVAGGIRNSMSVYRYDGSGKTSAGVYTNQRCHRAIECQLTRDNAFDEFHELSFSHLDVHSVLFNQSRTYITK